jgi:hypothetical protein
MRAFVIDDEFFNQSAIEATPRSSCRPALEKRLDTADIVREGRVTGYPDIGLQKRFCPSSRLHVHVKCAPSMRHSDLALCAGINRLVVGGASPLQERK